MNFFILTAEGKCIARPDSSRNKDNGDFYLPDDVLALGYTPCVFVRMERTGKAVEEKFAARYYDAVNFGALLYPSTEGENHYCKATCGCFDHSSLLSLPLYNTAVLEEDDNRFCLSSGSRTVFECGMEGIRNLAHKAIVECSRHSTIHKGDWVIAELSKVQTLCRKEDKSMQLLGTFCGNSVIDIEIKF